MRLVTYTADDRGPRAGLLFDDRVVDAWDTLEDRRTEAGVRQLLEADRASEAFEKAGGAGIPRERVRLLSPVPDPQKIVCIGLNYHEHAAEAGLEPPQTPTLFGKWANALVPDGATVTLPDASAKVDYEAEVAFVIGREAREVDEADALDHVAGFTLLNDLSARDLQFATPQWMPGKVFDGSAPCGPALVTPDELDPGRIELALTLNGEQMQSATTADLIFGVPALVAHLSRLMTLAPGDIVSTGTPAGVGSVRKPRVWLADGDEVVVSSPELGELRTTIAR